ncbi:unnamed protein product [Sphagnum jensenii]|uniref:Uncharacterized protein n=1 Tax=Sphagnum jensenii TaxID=128206 RepID=A0ABP0WKN0_9BRYO
MSPMLLLVTATKVVGVMGALTVAANVLAYRHFYKKNLTPFENPIDESHELLASFPIDKDVEEGGFFFALATAPAHVEDKLNDAWLQFAKDTEPPDNPAGDPPDSPVKGPKNVGFQSTSVEDPRVLSVQGKATKLLKVSMEAMIRGYEKMTEPEEKHNVAAWQNAIHPEERVRFWSDPDTELKLAQGANQTFFRMGVDWSRIMPSEPVNGIESVDWKAVKRYRYIIERVLAHGMRVMLTLFHHSIPSWAAEYGGWREKKTIKYFLDFTRLVVEQYGDLIDYWVTMNEPHVFAMLTYCAGAWPGGDPNLLETATAAMPRGVFKVVMEAMAEAHIGAYDIIHNLSKSTKKVKVGFAHHVSFMRPYGLFDVPLVVFSNWMTRFAYCDDVAHKCDFLGINYYGQEVVSAPGLKNVEDDEYSESGRGVYPDGLYRMLLQFDERYKKYNMPFIITENGVSDATDIIRRPYIIEHLLAVRAAMDKGVKIEGYCFWTISDNWEWADGYGPKFGLVAVDRHKNLERLPRPSYYLYAEVSKTGKVTRKQRKEAWEELQSAVRQGMTRPFCRAINNYGLMFAGGLDVPIERPFAVRDWRFGHYEMEGLQDPLSSVVRYFREGAVFSSCRTNRRQKLHLDSKLA